MTTSNQTEHHTRQLDLNHSVQQYLLPQVFTKRQWSLFVMIRIHGQGRGKPKAFTEFLRKLIGQGKDRSYQPDLSYWADVAKGEKLDVNAFFRKGLLGVLAHEYIRINLLNELQHTDASHGPFYLVKNKQETASSKNNCEKYQCDLSKFNADSIELSLDAVDLAFTHSGLKAMGINQQTLDSFPEAFRQGMAARTHLTGDATTDAAESWEGVLGQDCVHAMLTIHFPVDEDRFYFWDSLENEVGQFNRDEWQWPASNPSTNSDHATSGEKTIDDQINMASQFFGWDQSMVPTIQEALINEGGSGLRDIVNVITRSLGFEILQLELGQVPYTLENTQDAGSDTHPPATKTKKDSPLTIKRTYPRREHFGFRDGISQPFLDIKGNTPPPGGGTPASNNSWKPVAPGEIFLGSPDEDNLIALQPFNEDLRLGGTYLVFRKLEQDVVAFRTFLAQQKTTKSEQARLAAQIVGRWPDGAPVIRHPYADADTSDETGVEDLNDFRFFSEDPHGKRCPIGSHIRRTNPRDTSGRDDVKRHRILRRGIPYGGPLLPEGSKGDGRKRGLLFVCLNSKIDLQFELIQREWINGGEFLGQVGAGKCPLTGANQGTARDEFLPADATAPIVGIPAFVRNKGGEYFFVPSTDAIRKYVATEDESVFPPDFNDLPHGQYSATKAQTPGLLSKARVTQYARTVLSPEHSGAIRVKLPCDHLTAADQYMTFVGRYDDVAAVLSSRRPSDSSTSGCPHQTGSSATTTERKEVAFSVEHYHESGREITRGSDLLIAMDNQEPRQKRLALMAKAWTHNKTWIADDYDEVRQFIQNRTDNLIHRVSQTGHMDILQDLAFDVCYGILENFIGLKGPEFLTELAVSLPYARRHITTIPPGWLNTSASASQIDAGYQTTQLWARLAFGEVIGNVLERSEVTAVATQATSEMLTHIEEQLKLTMLSDATDKSPATVIQYLARAVANPADPTTMEEARIILADLLTTISMNIALPFSKALQTALKRRIDVPKKVRQYANAEKKYGVSQVRLFAYELLRLEPSAPAIFRRCTEDTVIPSGVTIKQGDWVAAIVSAAGKDPRKFGRHSTQFSVNFDYDPNDYLLFGPQGGLHYCWGSALGSVVLEELFLAASRFGGLQTVAGKRGEVQQFFKMDYSYLVKFHPFAPQT